ncbi:ATP-dependent helicase [Pseudomonas sp.]|uniref:ATP-dependent helicase n=1 Tax=Pseudomonas sp. TaxID=306 RepID=UPI003263A9F3
MELSLEQTSAVLHGGNTYVSACPGSGKTRALTAKIEKGICEISSRTEKVLAVTFTNRAAEELRSRIESNHSYDHKKLWAGTIHSFALDWIIRPYAAYLDVTRNGYSIVDEYESKRILSKLKNDYGLGVNDNVNTRLDRYGEAYNQSQSAVSVLDKYHQILKEQRKIDFDQVLYFAFQIISTREEIAQLLGSMFSLVCIDEAQDVSDLQYAILSAIYRGAEIKPNLFIVGDVNQAIYTSIGAVARDVDELNAEFDGANLRLFEFRDNYRSTQRIVDYFSFFRRVKGGVSKSSYSDERGVIKFFNQTVNKDQLSGVVAGIIQSAIDNGVSEDEICVIAPQWAHIRLIARSLIKLLPDVRFDAPALTPFYGQHNNFWLLVAKLALTEPSGRLVSTRSRWASEVLVKLNESFGFAIDRSAGELLYIINSFRTEEVIGTTYLSECFKYLVSKLGLDLDIGSRLKDEYDIFFEKANKNIEANEGQYDNSVFTFKSFFKESVGVVINTCHGVKGEEYNTVIAYGLLRGYIPHWSDIINMPDHVGLSSESKMLYVIASRAKKNLYLFSESGRMTNGKRPYQTSGIVQGYRYNYDL